MHEITKLKSMVLRPRLFLIIFVILPNISWLESVERTKKSMIFNDLPNSGDLEIFLPVLERIIGFSYMNKGYMNAGLAFGLHLAQENLQLILSSQSVRIPGVTLLRLHKLFEQNKAILKYYKQSLRNGNNQKLNLSQRTVTEFLLAPVTLPPLNLDLLNQTEWYSIEKLHQLYTEWGSYNRKVNDFDKYVPSPDLSDICLEVLSENFKEHSGTYCYLPDYCADMLTNGSEFGYFITHRLLFLKLANNNIGCSIFSETDDKILADGMCSTIYNEAEYIASNDYMLPDLLMEQMTLCSLNGDLQFLRRSWLLNLLRFQSNYGCMGEYAALADYKNNQWTYGETNLKREDTKKIAKVGEIFGGQCNVHVTAVGAALFATTIRYIVVNYYGPVENYYFDLNLLKENNNKLH